MKLIRSKLPLARFLTTIRTPKKYPYLCQDGPWKGVTLYLTSAGTLVMNICSQVGSYHGSQFAGLYWRAA